ncbi:MAG: hypothetical protein V3U65_02525 [Granulosicoccaceae bacterium]
MHTYHHHIENNGPADWQSTLRFDQSSILDFVKSLSILQLSMLFPVDTIRYFKVMNRNRLRKKLIVACMRGFGVILLAIIIEPYLAMVPMMLYFGRGWVIHQFVFSWHGFHDATRPYVLEAGNNSDLHYVHHKKPGVHLFSLEIVSIADRNRDDRGKPLPMHIDQAT